MHFVRLGYNNSDEIMNIELFLSNDEEIGIKNDKFYSIMLGVPCEMSSYEFQTFIEPFIHDIAEFKILICPESETVELNSRCALINFYLEDSCQTFSSLYNNLHFPTHRDSPPCIVIPITHIENIPFSPSSESVLGNRVSKSDHRRLPLCCVCLRRIKSSVSRVNGSNDLPVNTKFTGNGLRCKVCRIYGGSSSIQKDVRNLSLLAPESPVPIPEDSSFSKLRRCLICGLQENIWVCMSCAHTGCGRYTCQHAKNHYDMSGHPFSLELVSGRIWDYDFDTFVHLEKITTTDDGEEFVDSSKVSILDSTNIDNVDTKQNFNRKNIDDSSIDRARDPLKPFMHSSDKSLDYIKWDGSLHNSSYGRRIRSVRLDPEGVAGLGPEVHTKLDNLVERYERLLETQLQQQRMYYEKQLSIETSKAFYDSLKLKQSQTTESNSNRIIELSSSSSIPSPFPSKTNANETYEDILNEDDINSIVQAKLEISALEYEHAQMIEKIRDVENRLRRIQKENDTLVRMQHQHHERITNVESQTKLKQAEFEQQISELEQQVRDLSFYTRTRSQLKDEIQGSQVLAIQPAINNETKHATPGRKKKGKK